MALYSNEYILINTVIGNIYYISANEHSKSTNAVGLGYNLKNTNLKRKPIKFSC